VRILQTVVTIIKWESWRRWSEANKDDGDSHEVRMMMTMVTMTMRVTMYCSVCPAIWLIELDKLDTRLQVWVSTVHCKQVVTCVLYSKLDSRRSDLKRQSNEIYYLHFFHRWTPPQASFLIFIDFSNLAPNLMRYSQFLIDSPILFIAESRYSRYCLLWRVEILRITLVRSHYLLVLSA
jgi:hypothetical protein